jgi:hypothetical protein
VDTKRYSALCLTVFLAATLAACGGEKGLTTGLHISVTKPLRGLVLAGLLARVEPLAVGERRDSGGDSPGEAVGGPAH